MKKCSRRDKNAGWKEHERPTIAESFQRFPHSRCVCRCLCRQLDVTLLCLAHSLTAWRAARRAESPRSASRACDSPRRARWARTRADTPPRWRATSAVAARPRPGSRARTRRPRASKCDCGAGGCKGAGGGPSRVVCVHRWTVMQSGEQNKGVENNILKYFLRKISQMTECCFDFVCVERVD
jgi:hypothetical protein